MPLITINRSDKSETWRAEVWLPASVEMEVGIDTEEPLRDDEFSSWDDDPGYW